MTTVTRKRYTPEFKAQAVELVALGKPTCEDQHFYDIAGVELQTGSFVPGLWTRAFAEADGEDNRAQAAYIKLRVAQLSALDRERRINEASQASPAQSLIEISPPLAKKPQGYSAPLRIVASLSACVLGLLTVSSCCILIIFVYTGPLSVNLIPVGLILSAFIILCGMLTYKCIEASKRQST
jgi:hypothetical protein